MKEYVFKSIISLWWPRLLSPSLSLSLSLSMSSYKSKVGYPQPRWRLPQCVARRSFSFTDASHMLTFRAERWGAAANPEEDYGKMWRHYKISTSGRLNEAAVEDKGWHGGSHVVRLSVCMHRARMSDSVSKGKKNRNNGLYLPVKRVGWIVFSVTCRQSDCCRELWKQQVFTQCFTPRPMCYIKYSHMQKRRFLRLKWQLISQGNVTERVWPKSFLVGNKQNAG